MTMTFIINLPSCMDFQIFASDSFLELTEYSREEILGRNCRYASKVLRIDQI